MDGLPRDLEPFTTLPNRPTPFCSPEPITARDLHDKCFRAPTTRKLLSSVHLPALLGNAGHAY